MPTAFVLVNSELSFDMEIIGKIKVPWVEIKIEVMYIIDIAYGGSFRSLPRGVLH